uniref:Nucleolar MIF4G domain-containing protein 1-like n=1 Tax=Dermatophagoides pteronyssinus TaxID=6956 RepID=A0A6P6Y4S7_DERPT
MDRKKQRRIQRQEKKKRKNLYYQHRSTKPIEEDILHHESSQNKIVKEKKKKKKRPPSNVKSSALIAHQRRLIREEEKEIKRYEKLLKLRSYTKRNKLPKSFYLDGLADLIEFCNGRNENDDGEEAEEDSSNVQQLEDHDIEPSSSSDEEKEESEESENELECEDEEDSEEKKPEESETNDELREDIYGFLRDKHGNIVQEQNNRMDEAEKEKFISNVVVDDNVQRKLRGLLNRLTSSNIRVISNDIIKLNSSHSRHIINKGIMNCLDKIIIQCEHSLPAKLFAELAMLIAILNFEMSDDIGGYFIHSLVCRFDAAFTDVTAWNVSNKRLNNILILLLNIHTTGLIDHQLIYDIIDKFLDKLDNEKSIEIIDSILKTSGFLLRKEDPAKMKSLILRIQTLSHDFLSEQMVDSGNRVKFILESLVAIKNNNMSKIKTNETVVMTDLIETTLKSVIKKPRVPSIPGQYSTILQSSHWFSYTKQIIPLESIKGSDLQQTSSSSTATTTTTILNETIDSNKLDRLCRTLRLNTPLRRQLFSAIFTCCDYLDAAGKLISIGRKQPAEIINVILHVAINEKCFNQFYFYLLQHLIKLDRKYRLALDFAIRDKITDLQSLSTNNRLRLQQLMCHLLINNCLSITCLKVIEFSDMNEMYVEFIRNIFQFIFNQSNDSIVKMILEKIPKKDNFASAIKLFIACFMDDKSKNRASSIQQQLQS